MKNTANWVLALIGAFVVIFIVAMIVTYWRFQTIPDTLVQYTLGAGGIECLLLAGIKITKVIKDYGKEDDDGSGDADIPSDRA